MELIIAGIVLGLIILAIGIKIFKTIFKHHLVDDEVKTNIEEVVGQIGRVISQISDVNIGEIIVNNIRYRAKSDEELKPGDEAIVLSIEGNKLLVTRYIS